MFTMEVPYVPAQDTTIVLTQTEIPTTSAQTDFLLNTCKEVPSAGGSITAMNMVDPAGLLAIQLAHSGKRFTDFSAAMATIKLTQLESPTHARLIPQTPVAGRVYYEYRSEPGYEGKDQAVFLAEFEGKRYRIVIELVVTKVIDEDAPQCSEPQLIKIDGKPVSGSLGYNVNAVPVDFADLAGGALGQTVGSNITLDTNASGYNWFIDTTPADNSEFLPTSNPQRMGSEGGQCCLRQDGHA